MHVLLREFGARGPADGKVLPVCAGRVSEGKQRKDDGAC